MAAVVTSSALAHCSQGDGAGIQKTAIGLWQYTQPINADVPGSAIMGNLYMNVKADFTWGYVVGGKSIASFTLASDVRMVVRWVPPTRFALQIVVRPRVSKRHHVELQCHASCVHAWLTRAFTWAAALQIDIFDKAYSIDFSKVESALSLSLLFYVSGYGAPQRAHEHQLETGGAVCCVCTKAMTAPPTEHASMQVEHYNEQRFNVYFGLRFQMRLQPLVNAVIPGTPGLILSQMFSSNSGLDIQLNVSARCTNARAFCRPNGPQPAACS